MRDWGEIRAEFPMLKSTVHGKPLVYLDSAATAQKPQAVIDCINDAYAKHYGTVHRAVYSLAIASTEAYQKARESVQRFIGAKSSDEIIFTRGATSAINLVARSYGASVLQEGDEVLLTEMEHHANIVPWQLICQERGAKIKVLPFNDDGVLDLGALDSHLTERTKIVGVVHVSNSLGTINPVGEIIKRAHAKGARVIVDGAQTTPSMPVDVQAMNADFFVFSGHKTYGPTGVGVLYGKKELLEAMPPYEGGGDMIEKVSFEKTTYNHVPIKFEAGTPMIVQAIGLGRAIEYIEEIGLDAISRRKSMLYQRAYEGIKIIDGLRVLGQAKKKSAILNFIVEGVHSLDIATFLDLGGIAVRSGHHCTQPIMEHFGIESSTRASFAFYNTEEDVDRFVSTLNQVIRKLRP